VIANRTRLEMLRLLLHEPGQTVSTVASRLERPLSLTSLFLRALESRGLITAKRKGRWVEYHPVSLTDSSPAMGLAAALAATFRGDPHPTETIFRLATAFTHPRRIEIFRTLRAGSLTVNDLRVRTRIPGWALRRHLNKLETRGFVRQKSRRYSAELRQDALGCELARLALA
jgi:DNA-binding transcriptional ArsR family regulator